MKLSALRARFPLLDWFLQAKRIPLLFSVTIVSGIFYHYAPSLTVLWIVLSLLLQTPLFRLFDYMKKHHFLGGIIFLFTGFVFLAAAVAFIYLGYTAPVFGPESSALKLDFMIWFLTPLSVLPTSYLGYTIGLFLLFTFFIASVAYYFTLLRYRVLMSFMVMIFPFAVYAKENEEMPVPSILILLACYFAVMVYCRQAHAEDPAVVQPYAPDTESRLTMPTKKSPFFGTMPELLDGSFLRSTGIFIAASIILVLIIPKPTVVADRAVFDTMLDMSALSDYLQGAIEGFSDSSDGGGYAQPAYSRALFHAAADEPLNLRAQTLTNYQYDTDTWNASEFDRRPEQNSAENFTGSDKFHTRSVEPDAAELLTVIIQAASADPAFAEKWGIAQLAGKPTDFQDYYNRIIVEPTTQNSKVFPAPNRIVQAELSNQRGIPLTIHQSRNEILFSYYSGSTANNVYYYAEYLSPDFAESEAALTLTNAFDMEHWREFLPELQKAAEQNGLDTEPVLGAIDSLEQADAYAAAVESKTPQDVRDLALQLTEGLYSDREKAKAICHYLKGSGIFKYNLEFQKMPGDNVRTFLFENKQGVCYQFASAMTELCRAAGLNVRYVEGYAMQQEDDRLVVGGNEWNYVITTEHAHAFVEVYLPGTGWTMMDATAAGLGAGGGKVNILTSLQFSGLILFCAAMLALLLIFKLLPMLREKLFRRKFRKLRNAEAVQAAFARLRKQWKADPAETARVLCEKQSAFLQTDLTDLLSGFEETVYADKCSPETADRVFACYCAAYDAYRPAVRRQRKAEKAARKAARKKAAAET